MSKAYLPFRFVFQHQDAALLACPEHSHPWGDRTGNCWTDQGNLFVISWWGFTKLFISRLSCQCSTVVQWCLWILVMLSSPGEGFCYKWLLFGVSQAHVQAVEGLLVEDQVLLLAGCPLEDDSSLASCGVSEHCTLEVAGRLLGGQYIEIRHTVV